MASTIAGRLPAVSSAILKTSRRSTWPGENSFASGSRLVSSGCVLKRLSRREVVVDRLPQPLSEKRRHCVSDLPPLLLDCACQLKVVRECLKPFDFFDPKNAISPMKRPHVVRAPGLDRPCRKIRAQLQEERPIT